MMKLLKRECGFAVESLWNGNVVTHTVRKCYQLSSMDNPGWKIYLYLCGMFSFLKMLVLFAQRSAHMSYRVTVLSEMREGILSQQCGPGSVHPLTPHSPLLVLLCDYTSVPWSPAPVHTDAFPPGSERVKSDSACTEQPSLPLLSLSIHFYFASVCVCAVSGGPVPFASPVDLWNAHITKFDNKTAPLRSSFGFILGALGFPRMLSSVLFFFGLFSLPEIHGICRETEAFLLPPKACPSWDPTDALWHEGKRESGRGESARLRASVFFSVRRGFNF